MMTQDQLRECIAEYLERTGKTADEALAVLSMSPTISTPSDATLGGCVATREEASTALAYLEELIAIDSVTDDQIECLQQEAASAGDDATVTDCRHAAEGDEAARVRCAAIIVEARKA